MKSFIGSRSFNILKTIILNKNDITSREIENMYNLSKRQVGYSINDINNHLEINKISKIIRTSDGKFVLNDDILEYFDTYLSKKSPKNHIFSYDERISFSIIMLLYNREFLSINHFTSKLYISKSTFLADIKKIKALLALDELDIIYNRVDGYIAKGSEYKKILVIIKNVKKLISKKSLFEIFFDIDDDLLNSIRDDVASIENKMGIHFCEDRLAEMPYILYFIIQHKNKVGNIEDLPQVYKNIKGTKEYQYTENICTKYNITNSSYRLLITLHIQMLSIHNYPDISYDDDDVNDMIAKAVSEMIGKFEYICGIKFNNYDELLSDLLVHLRPAFYRIKYNYQIENKIESIVSNKYKNITNIVKKSIEPFEKILAKKVPLDELLYIVLIFGCCLDKQGNLETILVRKRAIIVCINGTTISNYLFITLTKLLPEIDFIRCMSVREFYKYTKNYDIIFSTTPLQTNRPMFLIQVNMIEKFNDRLREDVLNKIKYLTVNNVKVKDIMNIISKHTSGYIEEALLRDLENYFEIENKKQISISGHMDKYKLCNIVNENLIQIIDLGDNKLSWQDIISSAGNMLIYSNKIKKQYIDKVIKSIKYNKPYMNVGNGIIIAHSSAGEYVIDVGISITITSKRVLFNGYVEADIIIFLATPTPVAHLDALESLIHIIEEKENLNIMREAKNKDDILNIIKMEGKIC